MNTKSFRRLVLPVGLGAMAAFAVGCGSQASTLCSLECDCEHCNDYAEDVTCETIETQADVADAYDCADKWETWATCVEEKGRCEETDARFTTSSAGSCSGVDPQGGACTVDTDCNGFAAFCSAGMCARHTCAGNGDTCESDADCAGEDACQSQEDALNSCIDSASAHGGIHIDFD